jgi:hypothetical protein
LSPDANSNLYHQISTVMQLHTSTGVGLSARALADQAEMAAEPTGDADGWFGSAALASAALSES